MTRVERRQEGHRAGRRTTTGGTTSPGRTALLAVLMVALTAAALTLAGTTRRSIGTTVKTSERVQLEQRTFTCAGGIPGSTAVDGSVDAGLTAPQPVTLAPKQFDADAKVALGAFAGQESRSKDWLAWLPCPEPRSRWWFVAAGAATVTHDTVFTVTNPRDGQADVDINVSGPNGRVAAPGLHGITVAAGQTRVVDLAKVAPAVGDLAVSVVATRGLVSVSAADRFAPGVVGKAVQEWLPDQSAPGTSVTLAGLPAKPDRATLVVVNPRQVEAIVSVQVIGSGGTFAPKDNATLTVPPGSVANLPVEAVFDGKPLSIRVTSPQFVTAAVRTVSGGDVAFGTAVRPLEGTTALAVPAGTGQLVLSSLGAQTSVGVTAFDASGKVLLDQSVAVPKAASVGTALPAKTRYVRLVAAHPEAVAGFSVTGPGGVATAGVEPALRSVLLPVVRPGW